MSTVTQTMSYAGNQLKIATPPNIAVIGPGMQYWIIPNGTGGQFAGLNLPPVSFSPSDQGQTVDIGFVDSANNTVQLSASNPSAFTLTDGRAYLQGSSSALAQTITVKAQIMGRQIDRTGYLVVDATNTGGSTLSLKSVVLSLLNTRFCSSRGYSISNTTGDTYSYDGTNKLIQLTNTGITGVTLGFASNFGALSTTQHYKVVDASYNPLAEVVSNGNLADTVSGTATTAKYVYLAIGDTSNQISIASTATMRFVFILVAGANLSGMQTLISNAKSNYTTDITTYNGYASASRMTQTSNAANIDQAMDYLLMNAYYHGKFQICSLGYKFTPAGAYTYFSMFCRDGYSGCVALSQCGDTANVKDQFAFQIAVQTAKFAQMHEMPDTLQTSGFQLNYSNNGTPGDQDMFTIMKGYEYYIRTLDNTWLTANITNITNIITYLTNWYNGTSGKSSDNLFCGHGNSTYLDGGGNLIGGGQNYIVDPIMCSLLIYALRASIELNTVAGNTSIATTQSTWRTALLNAFPALWNSSKNWLYFNKSQDGTILVNSPHLMKVDALIYDALTDTTKQQAMLSQVAGANSIFWNDTVGIKGFNMFPTTDPNYNPGSYWYGPSWHIGDYKAFSCCFRYGTTSQASWAWNKLKQHAQRLVNVSILTPGEKYTNIGQFDFSAGAFTEMITHGLWGIDAHATYFTIHPNIYKLGDSGTWTLNNLRMGNSTWTVAHTGTGPTLSVTMDGSPVSGNIPYPSTGSHTLAITAKGRSLY